MLEFYKTFIANTLECLDEGVCFIDIDDKILFWNKGAEAITGYRSTEALTQIYHQLIYHAIDDTANFEQDIKLDDSSVQPTPAEFMVIAHKTGNLVPLSIQSFPVYKHHQELLGFIKLFSNVTQKRMESTMMKALTKAAYIDAHTELFNKQYIENKLRTILNNRPDNRKISILYINIADFQRINDTYGIVIAEKVLHKTATVLAKNILPPNIIGRWHGAGFIVIANTANRSLLLMLGDKLKNLITDTEFTINKHVIAVKLSIGYAIAQSYDTLDYIIERATKASLTKKIKGERQKMDIDLLKELIIDNNEPVQTPLLNYAKKKADAKERRAGSRFHSAGWRSHN